ncbi:hypothetical protein ACFE04_021609 [Oxalis oulophora]
MIGKKQPRFLVFSSLLGSLGSLHLAASLVHLASSIQQPPWFTWKPTFSSLLDLISSLLGSLGSLHLAASLVHLVASIQQPPWFAQQLLWFAQQPLWITREPGPTVSLVHLATSIQQPACLLNIKITSHHACSAPSSTWWKPTTFPPIGQSTPFSKAADLPSPKQPTFLLQSSRPPFSKATDLPSPKQPTPTLTHPTSSPLPSSRPSTLLSRHLSPVGLAHPQGSRYHSQGSQKPLPLGCRPSYQATDLQLLTLYPPGSRHPLLNTSLPHHSAASY